MKRPSVTILGTAGVVLIQWSYIPQWIRIFSTRNVSGLSPIFLGSVFLGLLCFEAYAVVRRDSVYIISNAIGLVNCGICIFGYLLYR